MRAANFHFSTERVSLASERNMSFLFLPVKTGKVHRQLRWRHLRRQTSSVTVRTKRAVSFTSSSSEKCLNFVCVCVCVREREREREI